jgi:hypothetical protein
MSACAAREGGTGPRTRRRWPRRAVRTGSNRTVVSPSCQVLVLCPHHVSVPVTARPTHPTVWKWVGLGLRASRPAAAGLPPAGPDSHCREAIRTDGAGSQLSPFCSRGPSLVPVRPPSSVGRSTVVARGSGGSAPVRTTVQGSVKLRSRSSSGVRRCMIRSEPGPPGKWRGRGEGASPPRRDAGSGSACGWGVRTSASSASNRPALG